MFEKKSDASKEEGEVKVVVDREQGGAKADAVFGSTEGGPNYVNVGWIRASVFLMKAQVGLGVLGVPLVFSTIGLIPGILVILALAVMTTWSSYVVGTFKVRHPEVHSIADVGYLFGGPVGREILGFIYALYMLCICGSGLLGISIALNELSGHGTCTVAFVVVGAVIVCFLSIIRTIDKISFLGWVGMISIMSAILTLAVGVGVQDRPSAAPPSGPWDKNFQLFGSPTFAEASSALGTIVFAFGGTPAFFNVVAEMRRPADFPKTVIVCQSFATLVYLVIGIVVYAFCGDYVASPALGSAGPMLKKVCYGLALPALIIGSVIYLHLPSKYFFVRILRGGPHLTSNSPTHWVTWLGCVLACLIFSFLVAEAVPVFGGLIGLVGALFGTLMSLSVMGCMWFFDNHHMLRSNKSFRFRALVAWNLFMIVGGTFITIAGSYGAIKGIIDDYAGQSLSVFNCADNSV